MTDSHQPTDTVATAESHTTQFALTIPAPPRGVCRECQDLAHYWSQPTEDVIELVGEKFSIWRYRCLCQCGCVAALATSAPPAATLSGRRSSPM